MVQAWKVSVRVSGVMTTVPSFADPITVSRGLTPFGQDSWPRPTAFRAVIDNDSLAYDPARPASLLYGLAGRNCEVRIQVATADVNSSLHVEATNWESSETIDHVPGQRRGRAQTVLTGEGVLGRISRWTGTLDSPLLRTNAARPTLIGLWPMEEEDTAATLTNAYPGGAPGVASSVTFGDSDRPFGAARTVGTSADSAMAGRFAAASATAGWQVSWCFHLDEVPASGTYELLFRINVGNGYTWYVDINNASYRLNIVNNLGVTILTDVTGFGSQGTPDRWISMRMAASQSGGNISWTMSWYPQSSPVIYSTSGTVAGAVGALSSWRIPGNTVTDGAHWSMVYGVTSLAEDLLSGASTSSFNGYQNEYGLARYRRIMAELGITRFNFGANTDTIIMGPQPIDTAIAVLKEVRMTDDGDISDERFTVSATTMRPRRTLYHQDPALELEYGVNVAGYDRSFGADGVWNHVTARDVTGVEYTARRTDGLNSVSAAPAGIGEVRKQVDVSVFDTRMVLPSVASWWLAKGTLEGRRYTKITVDLVRSASLQVDACYVREGDMITVAGLEADAVRLLVVGIEHFKTPGEWKIHYLTEPYDTYMVGIYDDPGSVWGTHLSRLDGAHTAGDTTLDLTTVSRYGVWTANTAGRDLWIEGERVTVSAMGAATGSGPYTQTATVTRAVNGVSKAQLSGARVRLWDNRKWGL